MRAVRNEIPEEVLQQANFRLIMSHPQPLNNLTFWLIDVRRWDPFRPDHEPRLVYVEGACNGGLEFSGGRVSSDSV